MRLYHLLTVLFLFGILSCSKKHDDDGLSQNIRNFVPSHVIDSMRAWSMVINEGKTPPQIVGIYTFAPNYFMFDNSGYNRAGT